MSMLGAQCLCRVRGVHVGVHVNVGVYVGAYVLAMPPSGRKHARVQSGEGVGAGGVYVHVRWSMSTSGSPCLCWALGVYVGTLCPW